MQVQDILGIRCHAYAFPNRRSRVLCWASLSMMLDSIFTFFPMGGRSLMQTFFLNILLVLSLEILRKMINKISLNFFKKFNGDHTFTEIFLNESRTAFSLLVPFSTPFMIFSSIRFTSSALHPGIPSRIL
jgi:hypothetical protein